MPCLCNFAIFRRNGVGISSALYAQMRNEVKVVLAETRVVHFAKENELDELGRQSSLLHHLQLTIVEKGTPHY